MWPSSELSLEPVTPLWVTEKQEKHKSLFLQIPPTLPLHRCPPHLLNSLRAEVLSSANGKEKVIRALEDLVFQEVADSGP